MATILIADDDPDSRALLYEFFAVRGYRVLEAADGADAVAKLAAEPPDLLLLDIQMPGHDGLEVLRLARARPELARVPAIAVTARDSEASRRACLEAGFNHFLPKPVNLRALERLVACYLA